MAIGASVVRANLPPIVARLVRGNRAASHALPGGHRIGKTLEFFYILDEVLCDLHRYIRVKENFVVSVLVRQANTNALLVNADQDNAGRLSASTRILGRFADSLLLRWLTRTHSTGLRLGGFFGRSAGFVRNSASPFLGGMRSSSICFSFA